MTGARQWRLPCSCFVESDASVDAGEQKDGRSIPRMHSEISRANHELFVKEERVGPAVEPNDLLRLVERTEADGGHLVVCNACRTIRVVGK